MLRAFELACDHFQMAKVAFDRFSRSVVPTLVCEFLGGSKVCRGFSEARAKPGGTRAICMIHRAEPDVVSLVEQRVARSAMSNGLVDSPRLTFQNCDAGMEIGTRLRRGCSEHSPANVSDHGK
jgi:hypothetical protein